MGLCNSTDATREAQPNAPEKAPHMVDQAGQQQQQQQQQPQQQSQPQHSTQPAAVSAAPAAAVQPQSARSTTKVSPAAPVAMPEEEYRSQIKSIFLFICDRLLQTMEYERDSMHQLAALKAAEQNAIAEQASYLSLFGSERVERFIRSVFDLSSVSVPAATAANADRTVAEQNFILLLKGAQQVGDAGGPAVGREELTAQVKEVCQATQSELQSSQSVLERNQAQFGARYADLQAHFAFFIRTLNFTQGDIANDAQLLESNVDQIISS